MTLARPFPILRAARLRSLAGGVMLGCAVLGCIAPPAFASTPKPATPPAIPAPVDPGQALQGLLQTNPASTTIVTNNLGNDSNGLDSGIRQDLPFSIRGAQVMDLTKVGLGIGIAPNDTPTEALDLSGYLRLRAVNGFGGAFVQDSANDRTNVQVWSTNLLGMYTIVNNDWGSGAATASPTMLFEVEQSGNAASRGDIYSFSTLGTSLVSRQDLRLLGGCYEGAWINTGGATGLVMYQSARSACANAAAATPNLDNVVEDTTGGRTVLSIDNLSGIATFGHGFNLYKGTAGVTFPGGRTQTSASEYGGAYSWAAGPGTQPQCTANYKTGACSCPSWAIAYPMMHVALPDGSCLTAVSCVGYHWLDPQTGNVWGYVAPPGGKTPDCHNPSFSRPVSQIVSQN